MKRIALALGFWLAASAALAQQVINPSPNAGIYGAYNSGAQTCVSGTGCWVQTDINGNLKVVIGTGSGTENVAITSPLGGGTQAAAVRTTLATDSPGVIALGQTTKSASIPVAWASDQVGTAGTANATVISVQGIAAMTKLLVTPDSVALPANQSVNTAQVNGVTTSTGTGVAGTGTQRVTLSSTDPCMSPDVAKSSAVINITSATTTSLVAVSGSTTVYVCGFVFTANQVITTANTLVFEYGTGATCTSPTTLTGTLGAGGITAGEPILVHAGNAGQTIFKSAASAGICALTAIGASGSFQGVLTFVQQ